VASSPRPPLNLARRRADHGDVLLPLLLAVWLLAGLLVGALCGAAQRGDAAERDVSAAQRRRALRSVT
jgi:hypothetical protein